MSNVEKTAWKIQASCPQGRVLTIDQALVVANVLEEAGLLMPDLPEPTSFNHRNEPCWETEGSTRVRTPGMLPIGLNGPFREGWDMHSPEARDIALALLAACEYAEKEQGNGAN